MPATVLGAPAEAPVPATRFPRNAEIPADPRIDEILVVDDSPTLARVLEQGLTTSGFRVRVAHDGRDALHMALEHRPDLVLADVMMPGLDGIGLTQQLRNDPRTASCTIILVAATNDAAARVEGFDAGADDYIVRPVDIVELLARVKAALRRATVLRAQSPLTRLPGNVRIQEEIEHRVRKHMHFALLYADLDNFKAYNDKYGFLKGDRVIQMTARVLQDVAIELGGRETFVGHVGGDDFVVIGELGREHDLAEAAIARFDTAIPDVYDDADRRQGFIETLNRHGDPQRFPIVAMSIGVATTQRRTYSHYAEAVAIAAEMKTFAKNTVGSSWAVDARG